GKTPRRRNVWADSSRVNTAGVRRRALCSAALSGAARLPRAHTCLVRALPCRGSGVPVDAALEPPPLEREVGQVVMETPSPGQAAQAVAPERTGQRAHPSAQRADRLHLGSGEAAFLDERLEVSSQDCDFTARRAHY